LLRVFTTDSGLNDCPLRSVHLFPKWALPKVSTSGHLPHQPTLRLGVLTERLLSDTSDRVIFQRLSFNAVSCQPWENFQLL